MNDGGPAFPRAASEDRTSGDQPDGNDTIKEQDGMSLRDWFAGQALTGYVADPHVTFGRDSKDAETAARHCYQLADAMLAERRAKHD